MNAQIYNLYETFSFLLSFMYMYSACMYVCTPCACCDLSLVTEQAEENIRSPGTRDTDGYQPT